MIKANELRIGNILQHSSGEIFIVTATEIKIISEHNNGATQPPLPNPIPLTTEWLERFGAKKFNDCEDDWRIGLITGDGVDLSIEILDKNCCLIRRHTCDGEFTGDFDYVYFKGCKFVHQLQNLYFALTGEELTIK